MILRKYLLIIILTLWLFPSLLTLNFESIERSYVNPPKPNFESDPSFPDVEQSFLTNEEILQESNIPIKKTIPKITQEEYLELKEFSEHYHYTNGTIGFSSRLGDQNVFDGENYQYYIWNDSEKSIQYANSKLTFYDWYSVVEQNETTVIDDCRWIVEYWREQSSDWRTLDLWNHQWFDPVIETKQVTFIQGYDDTVNFMNVSYVVRNQASVKVNIDYLSGEEREVRFVWQLTGMTGNIDYNQGKREFSFADIIISCNDTLVSTGFDYNWEVSNKKLDVRLGSFNVVVDDVVSIDPTFSEKQEVDTRDFGFYWDPDGGASEYEAKTTSTNMIVGCSSSGTGELRHGYFAFDTEITGTIDTTSNTEMTYFFFVGENYIEVNEYISMELYDKLDDDEYWNETEAAAAEQTCWDQSSYYDEASWWAPGTSDGNRTVGDSDVGPVIDSWVTHHNGDPSGRANIAFRLGNGTDMDWDTADYAIIKESTGSASERITLTFSYTLSGGNNAPAAVVHTAVTSNLYAGIEFTAISNNTDSDGAADLDRAYLGLGASQFDITFNSSVGVGALSVSTDNGSGYVTSISSSGSSITNGFQITWTIKLDWDFPFDDLSTIDTWARSRDDEPEYSSWDQHNTNADFENDLEAVGLNVSISGTAEYGGIDGWIEDTDWFRGGVEVTANGSVEYEGSSQTFNSSYAAAVNVTLFYDGTTTSQGDTVILIGVFSGITYTPTSASGLDTTAYFDVQVMGIPTNGSDVTAAGIEITSKRDNENPSGYSISLTADTASIGYVPNTGYYDDNSVDVSVSGATDGSGSGLPSDCYAYQIDAEGYGSWTSSTTNEFTSVADGGHTLYVKVRDNVANEGSADSTAVTVDTDSPTGFTWTWTRVNGTYPCVQNSSGFYFDDSQNNYTTVTINDDGTIQNSGFWKVEWDKNSILEAAANDTSGLPDNKNFNYLGDDNGTFLIRIINNAGNYQTFTIECYDSYDIGGPANNAPVAIVDTAISGTLYAGIEFTFKTNHTDADGAADLAFLFSGLGDDQYDITFNATSGTGSLSVTTENGTAYVISINASGSSITNGYQVTWTVRLDWDWSTFDDSATIDTWARSQDDEPEYSSWATDNSNADYENDLEIVGLSVAIDGTAEYGNTDGWIEDTDWFKGGVEVTANGSVEYEGSSQAFNSSYAATVNVTLFYDGTTTNQGDIVILSGVFSGITYTPTSASGLDTTAYFDVQVMGIPSDGSDVTGAGIEITSKRDNQDPTVSVAPDADLATIGYDPNNYYDDDSTIDFTASGGTDGSGSGLPANCYSWNGSAFESSTTKQYGGQSDGNISLNLIITDNVGNNGSYDTWVIVDTDSPTGFTITWTRVNGTYPIFVYDGNMTIYFDPGNECNNYTTLTINDDGSINNSAFWKVEWDKNSVFETAANDTSGLPDNKNFYYLGDTNGTFLVRIINNAGNYQTFNYTAYDTLDGGCGEPPTAPSGGPSNTAGVIQEPPFWYSTQFAWYIWMVIWAGAGIIVTGLVLYYFMKQLL